jgi:hypothetical protein
MKTDARFVGHTCRCDDCRRLRLEKRDAVLWLAGLLALGLFLGWRFLE